MEAQKGAWGRWRRGTEAPLIENQYGNVDEKYAKNVLYLIVILGSLTDTPAYGG